MGLRITTWNVNGIRNPFGYQPWRDKRTFGAMFEILEADIVVMQETKIQKKDLQDDMVLVPGWDVYFSLPKHKKGYSGVAIYTRNAVCAPIKAEEGITGVLTPPNSTTSFYNLPEDQQIGGYPSVSQLAGNLDAAVLDSEGRSVVLEFPAFVLIGVYNPANRDESRDEFRLGFLNALDARVRNLVAAGKRVLLTGDLNIIREEIDTANAEEQLRKHGMSGEEYVSTPARKLLNQLLIGGKVFGEREEGREQPVMWDICRGFHPKRKGMFTCWEQKINARPGNYGSRIDYVLCSYDWKDWFCESNIQEGLMGSDHCPVYAIIKDEVEIDGNRVDIKDVMNPTGTFIGGIRQRDWNSRDLLPTSARLIPEFDRRRSIRDMFTMKPSLISRESSTTSLSTFDDTVLEQSEAKDTAYVTLKAGTFSETSFPSTSPSTPAKRSVDSSSVLRPLKRGKLSTPKTTGANTKIQIGKGQSSLKGFFKPKPSVGDNYSRTSILSADLDATKESEVTPGPPNDHMPTPMQSKASSRAGSFYPSESEFTTSNVTQGSPIKQFDMRDQKDVVDPIVAKESWSKLLGKRIAPLCEHNLECTSYVTKKPGINCGRSFYICPRPVGPSGAKEKGTEWRCGTFIWSSDWNGSES